MNHEASPNRSTKTITKTITKTVFVIVFVIIDDETKVGFRALLVFTILNFRIVKTGEHKSENENENN